MVPHMSASSAASLGSPSVHTGVFKERWSTVSSIIAEALEDALVSHNQLNVAFPWYILAIKDKQLPRCVEHMEGNMKAPQIWLAVLRIVVGVWFLKAVWTKLTLEWAWGVVPYPAVSPRFLGF